MAGGAIIKKAVVERAKGAAKSAAARTATDMVASTASRGDAAPSQPPAHTPQTDPSARSQPAPARATPFASRDDEFIADRAQNAKAVAGEIATGVAVEAAQGALQGAAVGGAAGAVAGAVKGAAFSLAKDKRVRRWVLGAVGFVLAIALVIGTANAYMGVQLVSMLAVGQEQNTKDAAREAGTSEKVLLAANAQVEKWTITWPLVVAVLDNDSEFDLGKLDKALSEVDPDREYRDLAAGAVYMNGSRALTLPTSGLGAEHAAKVEKVTLEALQAAGVPEADAARVFAKARSWALGEDQCAAPTAAGGAGGAPDGDSSSIGREKFTPGQVANMRAIIGIAKTMFPDRAQQAATVGLITARVESRFQNYANDGKIGPEDGGKPVNAASEYPKLAYSLTLPHDAVGSDHASVGIMQQQATLGWGSVPGSDWSEDPHGAIQRLMTPTFAAARFFERMGSVSDWAGMEPGAVAQKVQISAFPTRYTAQVPLAEAIWAELGEQTPPVALPAGIGPAGDSGKDDATTGPVSAACGTGGVLPAGDAQALAQQLMAASDAGKISWPGNTNETLVQVRKYAAGEPVAEECTIDPRIFQAMLIATELLDSYSVNSLNRRCSGTTPGAGTASKHWQGKAIDFGSLNNGRTTGGDANSIKLIRALAAVAPQDSGFGQLGCDGRGRLTSMREFADTCHHLHFELGNSDEPLQGGQ